MQWRGIVGASILAVSVTGCSFLQPSHPQQVSIPFTVLANGKAVNCSESLGLLGREAQPARLRDARFYVENVALITRQGQRVPLTLVRNEWQNAQVALLDFEDASAGCSGGTPDTHTVVTGTVPAGDYTGVSFSVGVPPALNHTSTELELAPLDIVAMGWSWQAGRKFAKLEVMPEKGVTRTKGAKATTWFVHLGSTGCTGNPATGETVSCNHSNRLPVQLAFKPMRDEVVLNLSKLLENSELEKDNGMALGCMSGPSDPECPAIFAALGLDLTQGTPVVEGQSSIFSVRVQP